MQSIELIKFFNETDRRPSYSSLQRKEEANEIYQKDSNL